jgi:hypothetical protein
MRRNNNGKKGRERTAVSWPAQSPFVVLIFFWRNTQVGDDNQEGPSSMGEKRVKHMWSTWIEATKGRTGGSESRTDAEPTTAGSVMVLKEKEYTESERNTQQQVNPLELTQRCGFPSRKAQVGWMQQSTHQLVNGEGRWVQERQKWRGELQHLTWYSLFDHFQCFFHWITQKCSRRLGRIGSSS